MLLLLGSMLLLVVMSSRWPFSGKGPGGGAGFVTVVVLYSQVEKDAVHAGDAPDALHVPPSNMLCCFHA